MGWFGVDRSLVKNPFVVIGTLTLLGTAVALLSLSFPVESLAIQSTLPLVVGVTMIGYGWYLRDELTGLPWQTIAVWAGVGLCTFFAVGFWFGEVGRHFETSILFGIFGSLATGTALGSIIGVYAARLQDANERLADRNQRLSEFASIVSHDLRNPLSVAKMHAELLDADADQIDSLQQSLDRMDAIIDDMLTLTRRAEGKTETQVVDLATVARRAWETVDTGAADLVVAEDTALQANPDLLAELFENLYRNSVEHGATNSRSTADDGVEDAGPTVTVGDCEAGFYVADDGPGIPPEEHDEVFEAGYSGGDGTGLGLMIVSRIAEAHDWSVSVDPDRADGACFVFST